MEERPLDGGIIEGPNDGETMEERPLDGGMIEGPNDGGETVRWRDDGDKI